MNRRIAVSSFLFAGLVGISPLAGHAAGMPIFEVYRNSGCGCCEGWVEAMRTAGFTLTIQDVEDLADRRAKLGLSRELASCHFALADDYLFEGHIPPRTVTRFLTERPAGAFGLVVPGMPAGSPGMGPDGVGEPYDVLLLRRNQPSSIYETHQG